MAIKREMFLCCALAAWIVGPRASALNITIDYRYDVNSFFDPATTNGALGRSTLSAAASFFNVLINDPLSAIPPPSAPNVWRQVFTNPGTGLSYSISSAANAGVDPLGAANEFRDIQIASDEFLIYVGGRSLTSAGIGGTGGFGSSGTAAFNTLVARRGKPVAEFTGWGGSLSIDNDGSTAWQFDYTQPVGAGKVDLYSTALHEIGHVLGLNIGNAQWTSLQVGAEFRGPAALAAWKAEDPTAPPSATGIPTASASDFHWKDNTIGQVNTGVRSKVVGSQLLQEVAMDPVILTGTRKLFTNVDAKALVDIGWTIPSSAFNAPAGIVADFNGDGVVNGPDLTVWRVAYGLNKVGNADGDADSDGNDILVWQRRLGATSSVAAFGAAASVVPEPGAASLMLIGAGVAVRRCRNRRGT